MIGRTISHYHIVAKLGEGGMGVVYRAEDTRLKRDVAIKFLPGSFVPGSEERERFAVEAQAAASLNHPNIATIHAIEEVGGEMFIVMECIAGEELKSLIRMAAPGVLPLDAALRYAEQLAIGLSAAHHKEIVHRDIKSANIMITPEGQVKIMDFGLAKVLGGSAELTKAGSAVGTAAYMSPEQIQGAEADVRSDIFSYGVTLFEMLTGRLPFRGEHEAAISYSIVNETPPPVRSLRPEAPERLERIVARCLEKDPEKRYQHVEELLAALRALSSGVGATGHAATPHLVTAGLIAAGVAVLLFLWMLVRPAPPAQGPGRVVVTLAQVTSAPGLEEFPAWSPDGAKLSYSHEAGGFRKLFVQSLPAGEAVRLTDSPADDIQSTWSPDGAVILFVRSHQLGGKLEPGDIFGTYDGGDIWSKDTRTGAETKLVDNAFDPAFSADGRHIAFDASWSGPRRIWIADYNGRNPKQVSTDVSEAVSHVMPRWSPDGKHIVFQNIEKTKLDVKVVDVGSGALSWVTNDLFIDVNPVWSHAGAAIYFTSYRSGGLNVWRIPVSADGKPSGNPQQLTTGAGQDVEIALSPDDRHVAFAILNINADVWKLPVDPATGMPAGEPVPVVATTREDSRGAWSHDGSMIAFNSDQSGEMSIWVCPTDDGQARQLTKGAGGDFQPDWSPDGTRLVFFSTRAGNTDIWSADAASGALAQLTSGPSLEINPFYSPDGKSIAYQSDASGRLELWAMNADGSNQRRLSSKEITGHFMRWTKDGSGVLFRSPEASQPGIWSAPLDGTEAHFVCSPKGGSHMSFSPGGELLMDVTLHKELWVSPVAGGESVKAYQFADPDVRIDYPVWSPDGRWILFDRVRSQGGDIWTLEITE